MRDLLSHTNTQISGVLNKGVKILPLICNPSGQEVISFCDAIHTMKKNVCLENDRRLSLSRKFHRCHSNHDLTAWQQPIIT